MGAPETLARHDKVRDEIEGNEQQYRGHATLYKDAVRGDGNGGGDGAQWAAPRAHGSPSSTSASSHRWQPQKEKAHQCQRRTTGFATTSVCAGRKWSNHREQKVQPNLFFEKRKL